MEIERTDNERQKLKQGKNLINNLSFIDNEEINNKIKITMQLSLSQSVSENSSRTRQS